MRYDTVLEIFGGLSRLLWIYSIQLWETFMSYGMGLVLLSFGFWIWTYRFRVVLVVCSFLAVHVVTWRDRRLTQLIADVSFSSPSLVLICRYPADSCILDQVLEQLGDSTFFGSLV